MSSHVSTSVIMAGVVFGLLGGAQRLAAQSEVHEIAKLTASDAEFYERFGVSVSIGQNVFVSGAFWDDEGGTGSGSGYVYRFDGTNWIEEAKLTASDAETFDEFGIAVAISENVVVVGARNEGNTGGTNNDYGHGAAYVYRFDGTHWNEEAKFIASDALPGDRFGISVSVSGDVAVIGNHALFSDDLGSAHVYRFDGTDWIVETVLTASDQAANDKYAFSVSVSGDVIMVGAWNDDDGASNSGSVYVYRFDPGTSEWIEEAKLTASDHETNDYFGIAVSVSDDVVAIGALGDADSGYESGAAYVFRYNPGDPGDWNEEAKLTAVDAAEYEFFGGAVSISGDVVMVGARNEGNTGYPNNDGPGAVYAYRFDGESWVAEAKLTASEAPPGERLGRSVSITGCVAMAGAPRNDDAGTYSGAAYVFDLSEFCGEPLVGDLDGEGDIDAGDLAMLLGAWGACTHPGSTR